MSKQHDLERMRELREVYTKTLLVCDPVTHAWRNQHLLQSIAEFLIQPLQEYELEKSSRFSKKRTRKKKE